MAIKFTIQRFVSLVHNKGIIGALKRGKEILQYIFFESKDYIYYTDISKLKKSELITSVKMKIDCITKATDLQTEDFKTISRYRNDAIIKKEMNDRFQHGASLWLGRFDEKFVGFMWSIDKAPIEYFFFPLSEFDVYFFDAVVFPEFRGNNMLVFFHNAVLLELKRMGFMRGFLAVHSWNKPVIRSLEKFVFKRFGVAKKHHIFGRDYVIWFEMVNRDFASNKNIYLDSEKVTEIV